MAEVNSENKDVFKQCKRVISQMSEGKETRIVWQLNDWANSLQIMKSQATCTLDLDKVSLCFSLKETSTMTPSKNGQQEEITCLSLAVRQQSSSTPNENHCAAAAACKIRVDRLDGNMEVYFTSVPTTTLVLGNSTMVLKEDYIRLSTTTIKDGSKPVQEFVVQPNCLRYGISVIELSCTSNVVQAEESEEVPAAAGDKFPAHLTIGHELLTAFANKLRGFQTIADTLSDDVKKLESLTLPSDQ